MAKFKIVGPRAVAGVEPGGVVDLADDGVVNVAALIEAGHVAPIDEKRRPKPKAEKEDVD